MGVLLSALIFSLSSNLDNIVVGMAYGIKKIRIGFLSNLIIAILTSVGTFISMSLGAYLSHILPGNLTSILGALIIIIVGFYFSFESFIKLIKEHHYKSVALKDLSEMVDYAELSDQDHSGDLNFKETLMVGLSLSFNNIGTGIAASLGGVNLLIAICFTFLMSFITLYVGLFLGSNVFGRFMGKYAPLISGLLLILLGSIQLIN